MHGLAQVVARGSQEARLVALGALGGKRLPLQLHGAGFQGGHQALVADGELHRAHESLIELARQAVDEQANDRSREREQYVQGAWQPDEPHGKNQPR